MTALVGIRCSDGVVIASDSSATFSADTHQSTIEQPTKKVDVISGQAILAGTGSVGLFQRFRDVVTRYWVEKKGAGKSHIDVARALTAEAVKDFVSTGTPKGQCGALLAFPSGGNCHLCEFSSTDFQPEFKEGPIWFVSMGSGQRITDPFLGLLRRVFWKDSGPPSVTEGIFAATWTLAHVIELNTGGINGPMQLAVLHSKDRTAKLLSDTELQEHIENTRGAEIHLAKYKEIFSGSSSETIPPIPKAREL